MTNSQIICSALVQAQATYLQEGKRRTATAGK